MAEMEVGGEPCILCNGLTFRTRERSGGELLLPQLRVIYLVEKVFRKGEWEDRHKLLTALEELGDPVEWFELCEKCGVEVDRGIELWRRLKRAEVEHDRVLRRLKGRLVKDGGIEEGKGKEREEMRRWLKGERGEGNWGTEEDDFAEMKKEPVEEDDGEEWTPHEYLELEENLDFEEDQLPLEVKTKKAVRTKKGQKKKGNQLRRKLTKREVAKKRANSLRQFKLRAPKMPPVEHANEDMDGDDDLKPEMKITREKRKCTQRYNEGLKSEMAPVDQDEDEDFNVSEESMDSFEDRDTNYRPNTKSTKRMSEANPMSYELRKQFNSNLSEYVDNTLIVYPPVTPEDLDKIPSSGLPPEFHEEGQSHTGPHKCPRCPKQFSQSAYAIVHIHRVHLGLRKVWKCPQCPNHRMSRLRRLRQHMYAHYKGIMKNCKVCGIYYHKNKNAMDAHIIDHQKGVERPQCPDCSETFQKWRDYVNHMTEIHGYSYVARFYDQICELCGRKITDYSNKALEYHRVKAHGEDNRGRFPVCEICGLVCRHNFELKTHMESRHKQGNEEWFCEFCGKKCTTKMYLNNHLKMWHVDKPEACRLCGVEHRNEAHLLHHMRKRHPEAKNMTDDEIEEYRRRKEEEMGYSCGICGQKFAWSNLLYTHHRGSHPEITDKFKCDLCGKGFSRNCSLKRHQETEHEGKRAYCQACGKSFRGKDGLGQHLRMGYCERLKKMQKVEAMVEVDML